MDAQTASALHISMLGPWKLTVAGKPVPNSSWNSKKALSVFPYLLAHRDQQVHKDTLLNLFWPDDDPADATRSLHTTIYFLRRMIQPSREAYKGKSYVRYTNGMYSFDAGESCWIDVDSFLNYFVHGAAKEATDPDRALELYKQALALYRGDFLVEEAYEDWTEPTRNELRETFISLSLRASNLLARNPEGVSEAVRICRAALTKDPFREELHQAIMAHLIRAGRYGEAAAQYRRVTALLQEEFDLPPSPETTALFNQMQEVDSAFDRIPVATASDDVDEGPYVCDPTTFEAIHTTSLRVQKRHGLPVGLITITVDEPHTSHQMARIRERLQRLLRQSDVLCQQGGRIRILLLHSGPIGCDIVKRRVVQALTREGLPAVRVQTRLFEVDDDSPKALVRK